MFQCWDVFIVTVSILLIFVCKNVNKNPPPIFNIYQRPNGRFLIKLTFMYIVLSLRKWLRKDSQQFDDLEKPQQLSKHENAIDAAYLNGANFNGDHIVLGTARRPNNLLDGFLLLKLTKSNFGILESIKVPNTALQQTDEELDCFAAEGLKFVPIESMKQWKFTFTGQMKEFSNGNLHNVEIDADWTSNLPGFNFDTDLDPWAMATSMAYEKFNKNYFDNLKLKHQSHYEQFGVLKGTAKVDGIEFPLNIDTLRDHSFGDHREWGNFHKYVLHFVSLENGDRIQIGKICMPILFSRLTVGYYYSANDKKNYPISSTDLELFHFGEKSVPEDYAFSFTANGKPFTMQVNITEKPFFYISKDWECKVVEGFCNVRVNGIKGWGCAEWLFRNVLGKDIEKNTKM